MKKKQMRSRYWKRFGMVVARVLVERMVPFWDFIGVTTDSGGFETRVNLRIILPSYPFNCLDSTFPALFIKRISTLSLSSILTFCSGSKFVLESGLNLNYNVTFIVGDTPN